MYRIPLEGGESVYVGQTGIIPNEKKKREHESEVRLTKEDILCGRLASAEQRMEKEDGSLARHSAECNRDQLERGKDNNLKRKLRQRIMMLKGLRPLVKNREFE